MKEGIVFSPNWAEAIGYPHAREWILTLDLHHIEKLTHNGSET